MTQHKFKKIKEIKNKDFKELVINLLDDRLTEDFDFWAKMLTVKVSYRGDDDDAIINEIGIVIIGVCEIGTEDVIDMYFMPAWPFTLRTDADIRAFDSLIELYTKDRDDLIVFKDVRA